MNKLKAAVAAAAAAVAAATAVAVAPASADEGAGFVDRYGFAICNALDTQPNFNGVTSVAIWLIDISRYEQLTAEEAGQQLAATLIVKCPEHLPLVIRWAESLDGSTTA